MAASMGSCHLQSKEQFCLATLAAILDEPFASSKVGGASEAHPERKLVKRNGEELTQSTLRRTLNAAQHCQGTVGKVPEVRFQLLLLWPFFEVYFLSNI